MVKAKKKFSNYVQVRDSDGAYHCQLRECAKILKAELGQEPDMSQTARVVAQRFPTMSDEIERLKDEIELLKKERNFGLSAADIKKINARCDETSEAEEYSSSTEGHW